MADPERGPSKGKVPPLAVRVGLRDQMDYTLMAWAEEIARMMTARYPCGRCGDCCRQENIVLQESDLSRLAEFMKLSEQDFRAKYLCRVKGAWFFKEDNPCGFLASDGLTCTVYHVKPSICSMYPYQTPWFTKIIYDVLQWKTRRGERPKIFVHIKKRCPCGNNLKDKMIDTISDFLSDEERYRRIGAEALARFLDSGRR